MQGAGWGAAQVEPAEQAPGGRRPPRRWRLDQPLRCLTGACPAGYLPTLPLVYFVSPIPTPLPLRGRERPRLFHARGFVPCIPGAGRGAARVEPAEQAPGGGVPPALAARPAVAVPDGGLPGGVPAYPAVSLLCFPLSPCPALAERSSRRGRGRLLVFLCKGLRPLHPRGWTGRGTGIACGKPVLSASNGALAPAGAVGTRVVKSRPLRAPIRRVCKCRRRFSAGVPGAKPPAK